MLRFTTRDLLWLTVVMGLAVALLIQSNRARQYRDSATDANRRLIEVGGSLQEQRKQNQGLLKALDDRDAEALKAAKAIDDANKRLNPSFPIYYPPQ